MGVVIIIIEFVGIPASGKSTLAALLANELRALSCELNHGRKNKPPGNILKIKKWCAEKFFDIRLRKYRLFRGLDGFIWLLLFGQKSSAYVFDISHFLKRYVLNFLVSNSPTVVDEGVLQYLISNLASVEIGLLANFIDSSNIRAVIITYCEVNVSLERMNNRKKGLTQRLRKMSVYEGTSYLQAVEKNVEELSEILEAKNIPVLILDTQENQLSECLETAIQFILDLR